MFRTAILKENPPMAVPYFIQEHLWMTGSDEVTSKKKFGGSKSCSKVTLKARQHYSCGCCDDFRSCEQLKKNVTDKNIFKKLDFEP